MQALDAVYALLELRRWSWTIRRRPNTPRWRNVFV